MFSEVECKQINHYSFTGNVEKLKEIVEKTDEHGNVRYGPNTFCPSFNCIHNPPLITAVRKGNLKVVRYFVGKPVCLEINQKYMKRQLHSLGRDVSEWTTPLLEACYSSNIAVVKLLIELGADVNMSSFVKPTHVNDKRVSTPLVEAASNCDLELIKFLISNGAKLETSDNFGNTAIIQCVAHVNRSLECFKVLLNAGCNPLHKNVFGHTTLHRAASIGKIDVVATLLNFGISPMFQPALPRPADGQYVPCPLFISINLDSCNGVSDMLMSREDCPVSCKIDALKLRAAKSYICGNNTIYDFELWLEAVELEETSKDPLHVNNTSSNFVSCDEIHTVSQLNQMYIDEHNRPGTIITQGLVIVERCLGKNDANIVFFFKYVERAIATLIETNAHDQSLTLCALWQKLMENNLSRLSFNKSIVDVAHTGWWFNEIVNHFLKMFNCGIVTPDLRDIMTFGKLCHNRVYNTGIPKEIVSTWRWLSFDLLYNAVLKILSVRLKEFNHDEDSLKKCESLCDEVVDLFCRHLKYLNFMQQFFLHFNLKDETNVQILKNFLSNTKVFTNINKMLYKKTIIGTFLSVENIRKYDRETVKKIVDLLVDNGAHIDCVDRNGHCLVDWENRSTVAYECLKHKLPLSLMCLSARAVIHQKIDYDILPCHCKQFVSLHDSNNC